MVYPATVLAALVPVFIAYAMRWWCGRERLQPAWIYPLLVLAGGLGGAAFGVVGSRLLEPWFAGLVADQGHALVLGVVVVPFAEEIGKAVILLALLLTPWYRSAADGLLFGLAAGAGYATLENLFWFTAAQAMGGPAELTAAIAVRLLPTTLLHGGTTALVGAYLGAARWERRPLVVFAALPSALLVATLIHGGWNGLMEIAATETGIGHALLAWGLLLPFGAVLYGLFLISQRLETATIRRELEPVVREGLLTPVDLEAVVGQRTWRGRVHRPVRLDIRFVRAAIGLAFALRGRRLERRGDGHVAQLRAEVAKGHPASGRLSLPGDR